MNATYARGGARDLILEYISWSMNCLSTSTFFYQHSTSFPKHVARFFLALYLRWWASSKPWSFWSTIQQGIPSKFVCFSRVGDYARVPCCAGGCTGRSRFWQNRFCFAALLREKTLLPLLPSNPMDFSKPTSWGTEWPKWPIYQLCCRCKS